MNITNTQSQASVESFGWEWTERSVTDSTRTATIITTARWWRMFVPAMAGMSGREPAYEGQKDYFGRAVTTGGRVSAKKIRRRFAD